MDTKHCAVDGWVDAIPAPGPRDTVTFDLVVRPADIDTLDDDAPDTIVTCTSGDPRITHELLHGIQPGDLLRATGTLVQPTAHTEPARLTVDALEVLGTALIPVLRDTTRTTTACSSTSCGGAGRTGRARRRTICGTSRTGGPVRCGTRAGLAELGGTGGWPRWPGCTSGQSGTSMCEPAP
ncbi:hypothetical protein AB0F18_34215 [Streptomyces sp. NPDC029216]|uniref:hypothetical protein n=1 Tax=Streptomyces sp. NPDC029216 TaxID=3154701 RepID=UPI00340F2A09